MAMALHTSEYYLVTNFKKRHIPRELSTLDNNSNQARLIHLSISYNETILLPRDSFKIANNYNTVGIVNCQSGRPDSFVIGEEIYASKLRPSYQTFGTLTTPAAETDQ
jgi:hypothetical protein